MKINEKNLSAYSTSTSPVDKEGWLCKRGELNKGYQKRWFVLKGNLLFYFDRKSDKEPLGVVILEGCSIGILCYFITINWVVIKSICNFYYSSELAENDDQFSFKIIFHGPNNRSYILGADSQESMEQWMKSLACASYDYMKFMVADLQRQLKELEGILILINIASKPECIVPTLNHSKWTGLHIPGLWSYMQCNQIILANRELKLT